MLNTSEFLKTVSFLLALDTDNDFTPGQKIRVVKAYEYKLKLWVLWEDLPTNNSSVSWTYERTWAVYVSHLQKMEKIAQAYLKFENKHLPRETFKGPNFTDENDKSGFTLEAFMLGTTLDEFAKQSDSSQRYGQWLMNRLHEARPEIYDAVSQTPADCFYRNEKINLFWKRVSELWDKMRNNEIHDQLPH